MWYYKFMITGSSFSSLPSSHSVFPLFRPSFQFSPRQSRLSIEFPRLLSPCPLYVFFFQMTPVMWGVYTFHVCASCARNGSWKSPATKARTFSFSSVYMRSLSTETRAEEGWATFKPSFECPDCNICWFSSWFLSNPVTSTLQLNGWGGTGVLTTRLSYLAERERT